MTVRDLVQELLQLDLDDYVAVWDEDVHEYRVLNYAPFIAMQ